MLLVPILLSFFISVVTAIVVQQLFFKINKVDPINHRSSHTATATRTGGISIFVALFGTSLYLYFTEQQLFDFSLLVPLSIMFVIGVYDDFYNADFKLKFFIQIIVAKILIDQGLLIDNYYGLFGLYEIPRLLAQLSTVFVFLVIVNAINFIDGIDGLAISLFLKFLILFGWISTNNPLLALSSILIAGILPLYYFNFRKKQKVFLGDAGSLLLGTLCCIYIFSLLDYEYQITPSISGYKPLVAVLLLFYPLLDLLRVFVIRISQKRSPFTADRNHLHHLLLNRFDRHSYVIQFILFVDVSILLLFYISAPKYYR